MCQNLKTYVQSDCFSSLNLLFYGVVVVSLSSLLKGAVSWEIDGRYHDFWPKFTKFKL